MATYATPIEPQIEVLAPVSCCAYFQDTVATGMDGDGDFVVLYATQDENSDFFLSAQRYDATGTAQGEAIEIDGEPPYLCAGETEGYADIAMSEDGEFVVTWVDSTTYAVYAQKYNSDGTTDGEKLTVTTTPDCCEMFRNVDVDMDADGDFVVAWESDYSYSSYTTYAKAYMGGEAGESIEIASTCSYGNVSPKIAVDDDGDFVVAWENDKVLYAQQYDSRGMEQGEQITVASVTNPSCDSFDDMALDMDDEGNFIVSFIDTDYIDYVETLYAQQYSNKGVAGTKIEVATVLFGCDDLSNVDVAMDDEGDFVVTWERQNNSDTGDSYYYAQAYDSSGDTQDERITIDTTPCGESLFSTAIATDENGDFVVTWAEGQYSGAGVYAQKFDVLDDELAPPVIEEAPKEEILKEETPKAENPVPQPPQTQPEIVQAELPIPAAPQYKTFATAIEPGNFNEGNQGETLTKRDERDRILGGKNNDIIKGKRQKDLLRGRGGNDEMKAGRGNDIVKGGAGDDQLYGEIGKDKLAGGSGNDVLNGGEGKDKLIGGSGDDILIGGAGNDILIGNKGNDAFQYNSVDEGTDKIRRFKVGKDVIDVSSIFSEESFGAGTLSYTEQFDQLIELMQMGASTHVKIDADGLGEGTTFNTLAILKKVDATTVTSESFVVEG